MSLRSTLRALAVPAALALLAAAALVPALPNAPVWDDAPLVTQRLPAGAFFTDNYWGDLHDDGLYRPVALLLLDAQRRLFGDEAWWAYRAVNLALHAAVTLLVWRLIAALPGLTPVAAAGGGVVFALHPLHFEAAATVYGQVDLWSALFALPLLAVALARVAALGLVVTPPSASNVGAALTGWGRVNLVITTLGAYAELLLPRGQTVYYGHLRDQFALPLRAALVLAGVAAAWLMVDRRIAPAQRPAWHAAAGALAALLLPVANLVPIGVIIAERAAYLPSVGVAVAAAALLGWWQPRPALRGTLLLAFTAATLLANHHTARAWSDPLPLWQHTVDHHPRSPMAHARLALELLRRKPIDTAAAAHHAAVALQLNPRSTDAHEAQLEVALWHDDPAVARAAFDALLAVGPSDPRWRAQKIAYYTPILQRHEARAAKLRP